MSFIKIECTQLSKKMNSTDCIVFWTLVNRCNMKYNGWFETLADVADSIPCQISVRNIQRVFSNLKEQGLIDFTISKKDGINVQILDSDLCCFSDNIPPKEDLDTPSDHDNLSCRSRQSVVENTTNCRDDHDNLSSCGRQSVVMITTNCRHDHDNLSSITPDKSSAVKASEPPVEYRRINRRNKEEVCVDRAYAREEKNTQKKSPLNFLTLDLISERFRSRCNGLKKEVADIEAEKFLNYYRSKSVNIQDNNKWIGLADNWLLRDLDGNFKRNSIKATEPESGSYIQKLSPEQQNAFFRSFGFGQD